MKFFLQNFNGVFSDVMPHLELVKTVEEADKILVWQDLLEDFVTMVTRAQSLGKPVIQLSHCFGSLNDYCPPNNHRSLSDKICVWGQYDYNLAMQAGLGHKTVITGNPLFTHRKPKKVGGEKTIVYSPMHYFKGDKEDNHKLALVLEDYCHTITKVIDGHDFDKYPNPVYSDRQAVDHIPICYDVLSKADVVVTNDSISTFALLAMSMDIPVIFVNQYHYDYKILGNALKSGEYETNIEYLPVLLDRIFKNDTKSEQRRLWAEYCGAFIENPLENILREIK